MDFKILVKLKMKKIYKIPLTFIGILIFVFLGLVIIFYSYDKLFNKDTDIDVMGNLSVYYITGKSFKMTSTGDIKFDITNSSDKPSYFSISILKPKGNAHYKLMDDDKLLVEGDIKETNEQNLIDVSLDGEKTNNYRLVITSLDSLELSGKIKIRTLETKNITFADLIIKNNSFGNNTLTKIGIEPALEDEGLIKDNDDLGVTYYFRGNVVNNYVLFDNLLWRIVRINGDGTVRLVLNDLTSTVSSYYLENNKPSNYNESEMSNFLEVWYQDNIISKDYIANTKYCSDISNIDDYTTNTYTRIMVNNIPTFNCLSNVISNHIGLLTIDEVIKAGASTKNNNTNYYLYNSEINNPWYTMSSAKEGEKYINMFMINNNGSINTNISGNLYRGVRPVINLIKNVEMKGTGTFDDPYVVMENE